MPEHLKKKLLAAQIQQVKEEPLAEIRLAHDHLVVTIGLPQLSAPDAEIFVTNSGLRLRSREHPDQLSYLVPLPVTAIPGRFVVHAKNGVFDVRIERRPPSL